MGAGRRGGARASLLPSGAALRGALLLALFAPGLLVGPTRRAFAGGFDVVDAAPEKLRQRPRFSADAGSRWSPEGVQVTLGFEVPYSELFFRPVGSRFECRFDVIFVLSRGGRQVGGDSFTETRVVQRREETRARAAVVERRIEIPVDPGKYRAEVILREAAAGLESRMEWDLTVPDYGELPLSLSTLWAVQQGRADAGAVERDTSSTGTAAADGAGGAAGLPEADAVAGRSLGAPAGWVLSRDYGDPTRPDRVEGEIYRTDAGADSSRIRWRLLGSRQEVVQQGVATVPAGRRVPFRLEPNFSSLWLGDHELEVRVTADGREARRRFSFRSTATGSAAAVHTEQSLELISIIATSEEMDALRRAPVTEQEDAWARFWLGRDPTPGTAENEFRDEFFRRVRYANEHFAVLGPGWRSDRGRIFIQYGQPDAVESQPFNIDSPAYEIWTYQRLGRRFVFVDYDGFGRYELYQVGR